MEERDTEEENHGNNGKAGKGEGGKARGCQGERSYHGRGKEEGGGGRESRERVTAVSYW